VRSRSSRKEIPIDKLITLVSSISRISFSLGFDRREIPRFAQNDKLNYFFRGLFSLLILNCKTEKTIAGSPCYAVLSC
jgi:hypothetical protein